MNEYNPFINEEERRRYQLAMPGLLDSFGAMNSSGPIRLANQVDLQRQIKEDDIYLNLATGGLPATGTTTYGGSGGYEDPVSNVVEPAPVGERQVTEKDIMNFLSEITQSRAKLNRVANAFGGGSVSFSDISSHVNAMTKGMNLQDSNIQQAIETELYNEMLNENSDIRSSGDIVKWYQDRGYDNYFREDIVKSGENILKDRRSSQKEAREDQRFKIESRKRDKERDQANIVDEIYDKYLPLYIEASKDPEGYGEFVSSLSTAIDNRVQDETLSMGVLSDVLKHFNEASPLMTREQKRKINEDTKSILRSKATNKLIKKYKAQYDAADSHGGKMDVLRTLTDEVTTLDPALGIKSNDIISQITASDITAPTLIEVIDTKAGEDHPMGGITWVTQDDLSKDPNRYMKVGTGKSAFSQSNAVSLLSGISKMPEAKQKEIVKAQSDGSNMLQDLLKLGIEKTLSKYFNDDAKRTLLMEVVKSMQAERSLGVLGYLFGNEGSYPNTGRTFSVEEVKNP